MSDEARREYWWRITDEEWREFQSIPDQGYSHRAWVDCRLQQRIEWQSARDQGHIEAMEAEVEKLQARYYNATAGSKSLRPGEQDKIEKAIAVKRAEAAEALLARIREVIDWHPDRYYDPTPIESGWKLDVRKIRSILDEQKVKKGDNNE